MNIYDSIPLRFFQQQGYERNLVILTQPADYQKRHNRLMPILRLWLHRYPKMIEALDKRHEMYNRQLEYVREEERKGNTYVIRPPQKLVIGHISHDENEMQGVYQMGRRVGEGRLKDIVEFLEK